MGILTQRLATANNAPRSLSDPEVIELQRWFESNYGIESYDVYRPVHKAFTEDRSMSIEDAKFELAQAMS